MASYDGGDGKGSLSDDEFICLDGDFLEELLDSGSEDEMFDGFEDYEIDFRHITEDMTPPNGGDFDVPSDLEMGWGREDDIQPSMPFLGDNGLKIDMDSHDPIDFFKLLFDDAFYDVLVEETNRYFNQTHPDVDALPPYSRARKWRPVTRDEMKVFIALSIAMGLLIKPDIKHYWSTDEIDQTPFFRKYMAKDRYMNILANFHLVNNESQTPPGQPGYDPLSRVRPFLSMMRRNFVDVYTPEQDLSFDEGSCPWRGKLSFKVYNPRKPNKFHIKLYQVCEASSGWVSGFDIYTGKTGCEQFADYEVGPEIELTQTSRVVIGLLSSCGLLHKGHRMYMDNYYTSPELFDTLELMGTYACGTVRVNRKEVPKAFKDIKCREGQGIFRRRNHLLALKYHDKRDIHVLSTIHSAGTIAIRNRRGVVIRKPRVLFEYTRKMGGVDLADQIAQYYSAFRKNKIFWKKLFFFLLNMLICNAFVLSKKYGHVKNQYDFRKSLVKSLLESADEAPIPMRTGRVRQENPPERLLGRHFPTHIEPAPGSKRKHAARVCVACRIPEKNVKKYSSFECDTCGVTLCVPRCFKVFHTVYNYKEALNEG